MSKVEMKRLDPDIRINNFSEVEVGYTKEEAIKEASRCLNCKVPMCVKSCPVGINIPAFIERIKNDDIDTAYKIITENNYLPRVCGRVCPQENQCEGACIKGRIDDPISIGSLERYVGDNANKEVKSVLKNGKKIAVVGSGPSGLTCAGVLSSFGYEVHIYESLHKAGGVLTYGIPEFRLPKAIIKDEVKRLEEMGVIIELNVVIGKTLMIDDLKNMYDAIYIATGAGLPKFMNIPGSDANGVFSANEILTRINLMSDETPIIKNKKVFVIGGGNVAVDAARSLKRLGNDVYIMYRRDIKDMPARNTEIEHMLEEKIEVLTYTLPKEIIKDSNNNIEYIRVVKMDSELNEISDSEENIKADALIMALGTNINNVVLNESNIYTDNDGLVIVNDDYMTNNDNVYAGGDLISGSATVIKACEAGKKAANKIHIAISK